MKQLLCHNHLSILVCSSGQCLGRGDILEWRTGSQVSARSDGNQSEPALQSKERKNTF